MTKEQFSKILQAHAKKQGMTGDELGTYWGYPRSSFRHWFTGENLPNGIKITEILSRVGYDFDAAEGFVTKAVLDAVRKTDEGAAVVVRQVSHDYASKANDDLARRSEHLKRCDDVTLWNQSPWAKFTDVTAEVTLLAIEGGLLVVRPTTATAEDLVGAIVVTKAYKAYVLHKAGSSTNKLIGIPVEAGEEPIYGRLKVSYIALGKVTW